MKLSDLCINNKGSYGIGAPAIPYDSSKYTYLRITDINDDGTLNFNNLMSVEDENADKYILEENDIVFARTGASTGRTYFYEKQHGTFVYAGFLIKFSLDPKLVNPRILKYYTHSQFYYNWLKAFDTGGTRGNINAKTFADMDIDLPERNIQDKIVDILSSLDAKIETNNKINAKLEEMARALFKSWFVDFEPFKDGDFIDSELGRIPKGWKVGNLVDIANVTMGQSPSGSSLNENGNGIIFYQGCTDFGDRYPSVRMYTTEPSRYAEPNSTLMSVRAPVGTMNRAMVKCCIGRGVCSISSTNGFDSYIYYQMLNIKPIFDNMNNDGTIFGSVNRKTLEMTRIIIPPSDVMEKFNTKMKSVDELYKTNVIESNQLSTLRDTLLPKLMSGEIEL